MHLLYLHKYPLEIWLYTSQSEFALRSWVIPGVASSLSILTFHTSLSIKTLIHNEYVVVRGKSILMACLDILEYS